MSTAKTLLLIAGGILILGSFATAIQSQNEPVVLLALPGLALVVAGLRRG